MSFTQGVYLGLGLSSLALLVGALVVRLRTPAVGRAAGPTRDVRELAFLAGGPGRVADTALWVMHKEGRLAIGGPGVVTVRRAAAHDPVETAVLDAVAATPGGALAAVRGRVMRSAAVQEVGDRLAARGLLRPPRAGRGWRLLAGLQVKASVVLFAVALVLSFLAVRDGGGPWAPPVAVRVVPAVAVGLLVGLPCRRLFTRRITRAGRSVLAAARPRGTRPDDLRGLEAAWRVAGLAVALGGTAVLANELLRDHFVQAQGAVAASTPSGGSSAGSGGCGGDAGSAWCGSSDGGGDSGCGASSCGGGSSCGGSSGCGGSGCGGGGCGGGGD
ncbi:TIGR04222 domain-containing membrane protein [Streptomyces noursei]|uniref:TIGR04222 domain-containing membrane protein n=1 Tax=Streptomyces noursei TaxID=1971 RepID=UPI000C9B45F6|nr:TIGR04222 domain-containing membrane protein [Streptomyces noursei]